VLFVGIVSFQGVTGNPNNFFLILRPAFVGMRFCLGYRSRSSWRKSDGLIHLAAILLAPSVSSKKLLADFF
jgi:hypothetical protein